MASAFTREQAEVMEDYYKFTTTVNTGSKRPALVSEGIELTFDQVPFFELVPGDRITQIGDGRENGTFRTDKLESDVAAYLEYSGACWIKYPEEEGKTFYAFKFPEGTFEGKQVWLLYESTGKEVCVNYASRTGAMYVRFYHPTFKRYE